MRILTLPAVALLGLSLIHAVSPAYSKDETAKDKLQALQKRVQQNQPKSDNKPQFVNPVNKDLGNKLRDRAGDQPKFINQPKINLTNNQPNDLQQRLQKLQQQQQQQPKLQPKADPPNLPKLQPGNTPFNNPGNNNPGFKNPGFNNPGGNQDLKNKLEALKPKDGGKPGFPGNQPGNNPLQSAGQQSGPEEQTRCPQAERRRETRFSRQSTGEQPVQPAGE